MEAMALDTQKLFALNVQFKDNKLLETGQYQSKTRHQSNLFNIQTREGNDKSSPGKKAGDTTVLSYGSPGMVNEPRMDGGDDTYQTKEMMSLKGLETKMSLKLAQPQSIHVGSPKAGEFIVSEKFTKRTPNKKPFKLKPESSIVPKLKTPAQVAPPKLPDIKQTQIRNQKIKQIAPALAKIALKSPGSRLTMLPDNYRVNNAI